MQTIRSSWTARRGDTSRSPVWLILGPGGTSIDLTQWVVRAQLRDETSSLVVVHAFTLDDGVLLSTGTVELSNGRYVDTSSIQLELTPSDWNEVPANFDGILDIEISSDATTNPAETYTPVIVEFRSTPDITRWYDPDNLDPDSRQPPYQVLSDRVTATESRLTVIEALPTAPVTSVNARTGAVTGLAEQSTLAAHVGNSSNPHGVTKTQIGLGSVDNTADSDKPLSTASVNALVGKVDKSVTTAKGDLWVASAGATPARLAVGADGYMLIADSSQTTGIRWTAPGSVYSYGSGTTAQRPTSRPVGAQFFDTSLSKPVWWSGTAWVDASGASV